ncbi:hypothetical protein N7505_007487 [Penicillium chrysogenum]|uniref:Uncharacterized protein n=1 Tax=Penicillium chrysogenum TaxID=5076 RepID=A0ABQ8WDR2_PENCH|nr:hypothetical protein N7505_007487 [Penicillium chrysogenum]
MTRSALRGWNKSSRASSSSLVLSVWTTLRECRRSCMRRSANLLWVGKVVNRRTKPTRCRRVSKPAAVVNESVGRIKGKFTTVEYMPIHFLYKSVNTHELVALYAASNSCVVSSTRDVMNLMAYNYIASQQKFDGVVPLWICRCCTKFE